MESLENFLEEFFLLENFGKKVQEEKRHLPEKKKNWSVKTVDEKK